MASPRAILSVIGPHSGCGKTLFVAHLLRQIVGLGTLKISPARDWPETLAGSDDSRGEDFYLEDRTHLDRPGKDTALYQQAGAAHVERLRHRRGGLGAGLEAALRRYSPTTPVVVESSSAAKLLTPVAVVLIVRLPIREMKPATADVLPLVTDLMINAEDGSSKLDDESPADDPLERLRLEYPTLRPVFTWQADLASRPPSEQMATRLRRLLRPAPPIAD